jgi:signal transduction histidine kinase
MFGSSIPSGFREHRGSEAVDPFRVTVLAPTSSSADLARAVLNAAGLAGEVGVMQEGESEGTSTGDALHRVPSHDGNAIAGPVLAIAESVAQLDQDMLVSSIDRDFLLVDEVPQQLVLRARLLRERVMRKRVRLQGAERLRKETIELTWAIHTAESIDALAEAATDGIRAIFGTRAAAVLLPPDPAADEESGLPRLWTSPGGASAESYDFVVARTCQHVNPADVSTTPSPWSIDKRIIDLSCDDDADLIEALFHEPASRAMLVPIKFEDSATGALFVADGTVPARRTTFERSLIAYIGMQIGRAVSELWLRDRQERSESELQRTSAEMKRLVNEMGDLSVVVRSIADAVNVGVIFYDTDNKPVLHNRMVERLLGLTGFDPATGRSTHVYASDRRTRVKQDKNIISETLEGDQRGLIYWVGDPQGEQRAVVTEAHRIARPNGEQLGSAVVTYDVTDLANAIEIREEYLATVSHELRTPLTSIVGYLDLIDDGYDVEELGFGKEFRTIQRSATQMLALIRDLLSTSTRELALRIEPVDVTAMLTQCVSTFRPTVDAAHQTLQLEMPSATVLAHLDGGRIKQVVDNLISNAAKYTPDGGTITVTLERDGDGIQIVVADNGRGISKGDQTRLFDRFFRARDAREAAIQGVGIGLTIVKTIVDAHGGSVTVDSEPGVGSSFTVRLPARAESTPLPTLPMEP